MNSEDTHMENAGMMSNVDIIRALENGELKIYPYNEKNLTGLGYNISPTEFILSIKKGTLEKIHCDKLQRYVYIEPNDTVLAITKEYIGVNESIAGTFHSKVSRVCQGLGHVCTTLDPLWRGQLIVSINNPTAKRIKFMLSDPGCLCTLVFYRLNRPVERINGLATHDNDQGRSLLLMEYFSKPSIVLRLFSKSYNEIKQYIDNELVPSLNGKTQNSNGNILKYQECKNDLIEKLKHITEDNYDYGLNGRIFLPEDYIQVLKSLTLLNLDRRSEKINPEDICIRKDQKNMVEATKEKLRYLIDALNYEIEQEQQKIRITEQNTTIEKLVRKNGWIRFGTWLRRYWMGSILSIFAILLIFLSINFANPEEGIWVYIIPFCFSIMLIGIELLFHKKQSDKVLRGD